ncbi:beta-lactamase-like protein [Lasiosphaeris hirsuta]|uniref:Beta-lactamase-like protein n=1 Tax=Lasiosphaeris hirsuta TaxID=260670 RepID=A0AA40AFC5_9PEZI|nr:beta-lactamase-like protein [Lasiosphaeris hirsuta]
MASAPEPTVHACFEPRTSTWQYVVADSATRAAVIIDSVLDFDPARNAISTESADSLLALVKERGYTVDRLLETHAHADHLTASRYLQHQLEASSGTKPEISIGKRIVGVQRRFAQRYSIPPSEYEGKFDHLLDDDEIFKVGQLEAKAIHLPGHTPDHMGYMIGVNVFCGDSLFNTDVGSARCDFPDGNAHELFSSISKLFSLPDSFKIWTGHDYPPGGEAGRMAPLAYTTVAEQKQSNKHIKVGTTEDEFVQWRNQRDSGLAEPRLVHQALQFNIRAGHLPAPADTPNGDQFLHVPIKLPAGDVWYKIRKEESI